MLITRMYENKIPEKKKKKKKTCERVSRLWDDAFVSNDAARRVVPAGHAAATARSARVLTSSTVTHGIDRPPKYDTNISLPPSRQTEDNERRAALGATLITVAYGYRKRTNFKTKRVIHRHLLAFHWREISCLSCSCAVYLFYFF